VRQQRPGDQLARFRGVGAEHVAQHRRIHVQAELLHEVAGRGGGQDEDGKQRLERPPVGHQREQEQVNGDEHHRKPEHVAPGRRIEGRSSGQRGAEEQAVGCQHPVDARHQQHLLDRGRNREGASGRSAKSRRCGVERGVETCHALDSTGPA
jgi:hypothetical protein